MRLTLTLTASALPVSVNRLIHSRLPPRPSKDAPCASEDHILPWFASVMLMVADSSKLPKDIDLHVGIPWTVLRKHASHATDFLVLYDSIRLVCAHFFTPFNSLVASSHPHLFKDPSRFDPATNVVSPLPSAIRASGCLTSEHGLPV